jgi:hypothetical protein
MISTDRRNKIGIVSGSVLFRYYEEELEEEEEEEKKNKKKKNGRCKRM